MKFKERALNAYEQVIEQIEIVRAKGSRISEIEMTQQEFADFYNIASTELVYSAMQNLLEKHMFFDIQIVIKAPAAKK